MSLKRVYMEEPWALVSADLRESSIPNDAAYSDVRALADDVQWSSRVYNTPTQSFLLVLLKLFDIFDNPFIIFIGPHDVKMFFRGNNT